jgi:esterase FrsA
MAYEFAIDPAQFFQERRPQMLATGLAEADVAAVQDRVVTMWEDEPGGWSHEWSALAQRYARDRRHNLSALAFGWAKFPCIVNTPTRRAFDNQLEQYLLAASAFPVLFERKIFTMPHLGASTDVAVHMLAAPDVPADAPVILVSGGVDSWKMDLHSMFAALAEARIGRVWAFDIAGTGESNVPMTPDGGTEIVEGLAAKARLTGARKVAYFGVSMGGYFSARAGLAGVVDAAVDFGGPVGAPMTQPPQLPPYGMYDIASNALGFDQRPDLAEGFGRLMAFSLLPLLARDDNCPMLVINGAEDVHVPPANTLIFEGRRETEVHLMVDTGHCCTTRFPEALQIIRDWLARTLAT